MKASEMTKEQLNGLTDVEFCEALADCTPKEIEAALAKAWGVEMPPDENDFELPAKACDLSGEGACEACQ